MARTPTEVWRDIRERSSINTSMDVACEEIAQLELRLAEGAVMVEPATITELRVERDRLRKAYCEACGTADHWHSSFLRYCEDMADALGMNGFGHADDIVIYAKDLKAREAK